MSDAYYDLWLAENEKVRELEAELAELKARRCETCRYYRVTEWSPRRACFNEECSFDEEPDPDFCCNRHERREG